MAAGGEDGTHHGLRGRHLGVLTLSAVGLVALFWRLGVDPLRGDEVYYRQAAMDMLDGEWLTNAQHPPLVKELMAGSHALLGDGVVADRLPAAIAAWVTGFLIAAIVWRAGRPGMATVLAGLLGATLWWCLPFRPGRAALLEAPMLVFAVAAQWAWISAVRRDNPRRLLVGGLLAGLAAACKLTGGAAIVGALPAIWALRRADRRRRTREETLIESPTEASRSARREARRGTALTPLRAGRWAAGTGLVAALGYLATYLPMGSTARQALLTPVTFQRQHAADGHPVVMDGVVVDSPPWWAPFAFQGDALGDLATLGLWGAALIGAVRHRRILAPVIATLGGLVVALTLSPLKLPNYQFAWLPFLVILAAAALVPARSPEPAPGSGAPIRRRADLAATRPRPPRFVLVTAAAVIALLVPVTGSAAQHLRAIEQLEPTDYALLESHLQQTVLEDSVLVVWADPRATRAALPDREISTYLPPDLDPPALLYGRNYAMRKQGMDLALWERCRAATYQRFDLGNLVLYVRDDTASDLPEGDRSEHCQGLRQR